MARIPGIDVSHWQAPGSATIAASGARYAWVKLSQGGTSRDVRAVPHWRWFGTHGIARGGYHFYDWRSTPEQNAANFVAALKGLTWELRPVLDAEQDPPARLDRAGVAGALLRTLELIEAGTGVVPIVYTSDYWWSAHVEARHEFTRYVPWIARYPNRYANGAVPADDVWTEAPPPWVRAIVWQFSTHQNLDRNLVNAADFPSIHADPSPTIPIPPPAGDFTMDAAAKARFDAIDNQLDALGAAMPHKAFVVRDKTDRKAWICSDAGRWHVPDMATLNILIFTGQVQGFGTDGIPEVGPEFLDGIPITNRPV